jgi:hypothetical protein
MHRALNGESNPQELKPALEVYANRWEYSLSIKAYLGLLGFALEKRKDSPEAFKLEVNQLLRRMNEHQNADVRAAQEGFKAFIRLYHPNDPNWP